MLSLLQCVPWIWFKHCIKWNPSQLKSCHWRKKKTFIVQHKNIYFDLPVVFWCGLCLLWTLLPWLLQQLLTCAPLCPGVPAAPLSSALSAHLCRPLAHHPGLHGQIHARRIQWLTSEDIYNTNSVVVTLSNRWSDAFSHLSGSFFSTSDVMLFKGYLDAFCRIWIRADPMKMYQKSNMKCILVALACVANKCLLYM